MILTSVLTGPEAGLAISLGRHQRRQLQANEQPGEWAISIIVPDRGSIAVLVVPPSHVRGGDFVEGISAANSV